MKSVKIIFNIPQFVPHTLSSYEARPSPQHIERVEKTAESRISKIKAQMDNLHGWLDLPRINCIIELSPII